MLKRTLLFPTHDHRRPPGLATLVLTLALILSACGDSDAESGAATDAPSSGGTTTTGNTPASGGMTATGGAPTGGAPTGGTATGGMMTGGTNNLENPDCDPLIENTCALPWPSNQYLADDTARVTGFTLTFGPTTLPANANGRHVDPAPYTRMDGYSLGTPLIVKFPNIDIANLPSEPDPSGSVQENAPIVWLEVDSDGTVLRQIPYWVELDDRAREPEDQVLFVRPLVILNEATRYVIAMRNLSTIGGDPIAPSAAFSAVVNGDASAFPQLAPRQARFDEIFTILEGQGIAKSELILAWDFVTASSDAMHGPLLHMLDEAFADSEVGEDGPMLTITNVEVRDPMEDPLIAYRVEGTFRVPHFMTPRMIADGVEGFVFNLGADGLPEANGYREASFWLAIPRSATDGNNTPHNLVLYGHGLLGNGSRAWASFNNVIANNHNLIFFGADLVGMAAVDRDAVTVMVSQDLGQFPILADRLHQGMMEYVLLTRAMRNRLGAAIAANSDLQNAGITLDTNEVYYSGISQGGIFGGTFVALSKDVTRGHLGVPGHNYSTLLHRSVDFNPFLTVLGLTYPSTTDLAILLSSIQLLWDGTDPTSYYRHLQEPFDNYPASSVVLAPAKGDWQVSVMTNEIVARSGIGVALMANYDDEITPWNISPTAYPHTGSGVVLYHFGNDWPEPGNTPPAGQAEASQCDSREMVEMNNFCDPHEFGRRNDTHNQQMVHFFRTGEIIDVCNNMICMFPRVR